MRKTTKKPTSTTPKKPLPPPVPDPAPEAIKSLTIRCETEILDLADALGQSLDLNRTDTFKLGIRLVQRHLDTLLEYPNQQRLYSLMTRYLPQLKKFDVVVGRQKAGNRSELAAVWRDFETVQRIEDEKMREDNLAALEQKLKLIFAKAKLREPKATQPMEVIGLELA